ncbi:unnamed protein product [Boreogadus saida]
MDKLLLQTHSNWKYKECSAICLTTTWLDEYTPDAAVNIQGRQLIRGESEQRHHNLCLQRMALQRLARGYRASSVLQRLA